MPLISNKRLRSPSVNAASNETRRRVREASEPADSFPSQALGAALLPAHTAQEKGNKRELRSAKKRRRTDGESESEEEAVAGNKKQEKPDVKKPRKDVARPEDSDDRSDEDGEGGACMEIVEPDAWLERLTVCATHPIALPGEHVDDDAAREQSFVLHAQRSVEEALKKLETLGVAWRRPANYYAEMMKSDAHMHKVREELQRSEEAIRRRAQRRQQTYQKKYSKELKSEQATKEAARKRQLAIAVESAKRRSAKRMKEEAATSRLFGSALARDSMQRGKKKGAYQADDDDDQEANYYEKKNDSRGAKRPGASRHKVQKKRPGKLARRKMGSR